MTYVGHHRYDRASLLVWNFETTRRRFEFFAMSLAEGDVYYAHWELSRLLFNYEPELVWC